MTQQNIQQIVIVGGGTAGWMTAAALSTYIRFPGVTITLVESDEIGTVGVGEATIPGIRDFNQKLGIDEAEFMRATKATYKLGIEFVNWSRKGHAYMHPFGFYGHDLNALPFYQYWLKMREQGDSTPLSSYSVATMAAQAAKFSLPHADPRSVLSTYFYAFHLDAGLYAGYLRKFSEHNGVRRREGKVVDVQVATDSGNIKLIQLADGQQIEGDLFIDCTGFSALLIEQHLHSGFTDWSHWLPADSAIAVASAKAAHFPSHTRATAHDKGWQWRIPLQHRTGNGIVYSSQFMDDDEARQCLLDNLDSEPLAEARKLSFTTGMRNQSWVKNCVAIGLSAGFLEPLESTSIHLIQTGIMKLINLFPDRHFDPAKQQEYNRQMRMQFEQVRDFIVLHYKATQRDDSAFWRHCRDMSIPDSLKKRIDLFRSSAHVIDCSHELFVETNWVAVLLGQDIYPQCYNSRADNLSSEQLSSVMSQMRQAMSEAVRAMPSHDDFLQQNNRLV